MVDASVCEDGVNLTGKQLDELLRLPCVPPSLHRLSLGSMRLAIEQNPDKKVFRVAITDYPDRGTLYDIAFDRERWMVARGEGSRESQLIAHGHSQCT